MEEQTTQPDPSDLVIDDLLNRIARTSLEAANWKARTIIAEDALAQIVEAAEDETEEEEDVAPTE